MSLKHKIIIFLCTALNFAAATTQATQTDPLPGMYTLPTVQPISFSGAVISQALKAVQIREQVLRAEICEAEEKGREDLNMYAYKSTCYQQMILLTKMQQTLGVHGHIAIVCFRDQKALKDTTYPHQQIMIHSDLNNYFVSEQPCSQPPMGIKFDDVSYLIRISDGGKKIRSQKFPEGTIKALIFQEHYNAKPFLGRFKGLHDSLRLRVSFTGSFDKHYWLEPVEGEYYVDDQGCMMPIFTMVAKKKTAAEEMK